MATILGLVVSSRRRLVGAALIAGASAMAAAQGEERFAAVSVADGVATWTIHAGGYEASVLTLTPAGEDPVTFEPWPAGDDPAVSELPDGLYKYEIYLMPAGMTTQGDAEANGPTDENGRTVSAGLQRRVLKRERIQSGAFTVLEGNRVDPGAAE